MSCRKSSRLAVGKLGNMMLQPGFYIYVGSALGPGGIKARVSRHRRRNKKLHWHIDYLRRQTALIETWTMTGTINHEHAWAAALTKKYVTACNRFGASDCRCSSHLFYTAIRPSPDIIDALCCDIDSRLEVKIF
ncbi:MAG: GIY-YIG nuclease family protein [Gammaproteobacteria bacterium]|nr:GIY-YIG nuclease family protein [Gammaproteobacteria bacterium]